MQCRGRFGKEIDKGFDEFEGYDDSSFKPPFEDFFRGFVNV